jgi:formate hydrogenlyase subunit 6/NADH:ubiquinone oxidoreductase subunit I
MGAFKFEEENRQKNPIANPNWCVVFYRGCEDICPENAIKHPSEEKIQKIIDRGRKPKSSDMRSCIFHDPYLFIVIFQSKMRNQIEKLRK